MENKIYKHVFNDVIRKKTTFKTNEIFNEIQQEYGLNRILFNPRKPSPNIFMNKLHKRMDQYYSSLSKRCKILKK